MKRVQRVKRVKRVDEGAIVAAWRNAALGARIAGLPDLDMIKRF